MRAALDTGLGRATTIVAYSDQMACGALKMLQSAGLRIPEDVSLIGWNDIDECISCLTPPLTTVRTSPREFALAAVKLLEERIAGKDLPLSIDPDSLRTLVPVELVVRKSTAISRYLLPSP